MSKIATKAVGNVFYEARFLAARTNDRLGSREGAAEELGIDRTRLARIELGSMAPYPEEVLLMADAYNAPELKNLFCRNMCPLGCDGNMVYLDNDKAVELSVEYFKKDDKAEKKAAPPKEKPKQKTVSKNPTPSKEKPKQKEALKKPTGEAKKTEAPVPAEKPEDIKEPEKPKQQPKSNKKEIDGQMSLFDF